MMDESAAASYASPSLSPPSGRRLEGRKRERSSAAPPAVKGAWRVPALLIALSAVPVAAGVVRLIGLAGGAEITPENARFFADPVPAALHILSVSVWCVLGAFQFSPGLRRRSPGWHRGAGRVLVPVGLIAALSGLWLTWTYPPVDHDGPLLYALRLAVGSAMALCICLGFAAIRRRDIAGHRAWMVRGYALALGAGTQVLTHVPWLLFGGIRDEIGRVLAMGAGWAINLAVAEWILRSAAARGGAAGAVIDQRA
ncbi:DUF2306 domain-containing protein [Sorangium sp. So ce542]|uniref:DUF2306 domain-containing protein n=1 Tax=Sorangium sp. So ce542 TaxID=3133316 RepID=UPI003F5DFFA0